MAIQEITDAEILEQVAGGEVGATKQGDNTHYIGDYGVSITVSQNGCSVTMESYESTGVITMYVRSSGSSECASTSGWVSVWDSGKSSAYGYGLSYGSDNPFVLASTQRG